MTIEIAELPPLEAAILSPGVAGFDEVCRRLFSQDSRLLRYEDKAVAFRNHDLRQLAADPRLGQTPPAVMGAQAFNVSDGRGGMIFGASLSRLIGNQFFTANPPIHKPLRQILARQLMPKSVAGLVSLAERITRQIIAEMPMNAPVDFTTQFAAPLTARFFGTLLGLTEEEENGVVHLSTALNPLFFLNKTVDELTAADAAAQQYITLITTAVNRTLAAGGNELINTMAAELAQLEIEDDPQRAGIVPESLGLMMASNLLDGFHTAAIAASNTVFLLLRHPHEMTRVRTDPALARAAVYESLRMLSPLTVTQRYALSEIEYATVRIPENTQVIMLWAVGNRDPLAFPDPDKFNLERPRRNETTFGGGVHICPGRHVAGMIAEVVVREVCARNVEIAPATASYDWINRSALCHLVSMPVTMVYRDARP